MRFLGKYSFTQGSDVVQIDSTGKLVVAAPPVAPADGERFNAYGTEASFTLQASNGKFVTLAGSSYVADKQSDNPINHFTITGNANAVQVHDLGVSGSTGDHVWEVTTGALAPSAPVTPAPPGAEFELSIVTVGTETILSSGFSSSQPDLRWVNLAGVDLSSAGLLDMSTGLVGNANFSGVTFLEGANLASISGEKADFTKATMPDISLQGATLPCASFVGVTMTGTMGADLSNGKFVGADFTDVHMKGSANLGHAVFDGATMTRANLSDAANIIDTSFVGADLTSVDFMGASVTGVMDLRNADLTDAKLSNPSDSVTIYPNFLKVDSATNFRGATIQYLDFSGYDLSLINFARADLTGCKLDNANLTKCNFGFATLDHATLTGGISMHGANLSNASLRRADLTGAQLGGISQLFRVDAQQSDYTAFLDGLRSGDKAAVQTVFTANHHALVGSISVRPSAFAPETAWQVQDDKADYTVFLECMAGVESLNVYLPTTPAVLSNAFMVDVNLKDANLYNVRASGAQIYATVGRSVNLNRAKVDGLQANNANLGEIDLGQAYLAGVNFDYAVLTGANFVGATMTVDATGGQPSFNGANLQGARFGTATLRDVIFTNAAMAVANPNDPNSAAGVWLFDLEPAQAEIVTAELDAASADPNAKLSDPRHVFTLPIQLLPTMDAAGPVPHGVGVAFSDANVTLAKDALLVPYSTELFWKVSDGGSDWVIFRSVNDDYAPALGVAQGAAYTTGALFYLPLALEGKLGNGPLDQDVIKAFKKAGHPVGASATVTTAPHPIVWQVISGDRIYTLWIIYESNTQGVTVSIMCRPTIPNLVSAFGNVSMPLSAQSRITRLQDGGWKISNDAENPFNSAQGYIEFQAFPQSGGGLSVYGSLIRIVRLGTKGEQTYHNIRCATTELTAAELEGAGNTICPNGASVQANKGDGLPFDQWLSARFLPRPPRCVPDPNGNFNCP